jgi:putative transposase
LLQNQPTNKEILGFSISKERNKLVATERFLSISEVCDKHPVSTDDGVTWYPQARKFLKFDHHHINSA